MIRLHSLSTGYFKLDGGAMFGIVPKRIWNKLNPADANNLCTWALRCLLIRTDDRNILVDTGLGDKQDEKFRSFFEPHGQDSLLHSLLQSGLNPEDITDVFLTHLHFDHVGGAVLRNADGQLRPTFPNARYWTNRTHLDWAIRPNPREKASFLPENFIPLQEAGVLHFIESEGEWLPGISVQFSQGHTEAMMLLHIDDGRQHLVYCADLLPSSWHVGLPYIMSYDLRPLDTLAEKTALLEQAAEKGWILFFEHDPVAECARVVKNDRGGVEIEARLPLSEAWQAV